MDSNLGGTHRIPHWRVVIYLKVLALASSGLIVLAGYPA
jgi:hypothetical protein